MSNSSLARDGRGLRPLIRGNVLIDLGKLLIAILDLGVRDISLVNDYGLQQKRRNVDLPVVDRGSGRDLLALGQGDGGFSCSVRELRNGLVNRHGLRAG